MANESIKQDIILNIRENNNNEITGEILQSVLLAMVDALGKGAQFMGEAVQTTVPATGDSNMFYLAVHAGTYPSFNVTTEHPSLLTNQGGTWHALSLTDLPIWNGAEAGSIIVGSRTNSATDEQAYAEGYDTSASAPQAHAEGNGSKAMGDVSHAEGYGSNATGDMSHAEGSGTAAQGSAAHSEGDATTAIGDFSHAEGSGTTASGAAAHAEGEGTQALKKGAHAEGQNTTANGGGAHAEGVRAEAAAKGAHAEGTDTEARAEDAHAEGYATVAAGIVSHAEGSNSSANGAVSHAEGSDVAAGGDYSHAEGEGTRTTNEAEHAEGKFNKSNTGTRHSVGIGTSNNDRKNAAEIMDNGDVYIYGFGGYDGTNAGQNGVIPLANVGVQAHVIAEALTSLRYEINSFEQIAQGKDEAILPTLKAQTIDADEWISYGAPRVLVSDADGAPSAANIPTNWDERTMDVWDGYPRFIGQQYIDKTNKKLYVALALTGSVNDWVLMN